MSSRHVRVAVIGLGFMGRNHLRSYGEMDHVEVVAVADSDREVLGRTVRGRTVQPYADYRELLRDATPDIVSIAVPTGLHWEVAMVALEAGVSILIEKPIASSVEQGMEIAQAARSRGLKATVGHIERFNPGVAEMKRRLDDGLVGRVVQVLARRTGPFQERLRDVGVARDLATHDLDVMRHVLGSEVTHLYAQTQTGVRTSFEDALFAILRFDNGVSALLDVNWLSPLKVRELTVRGEGGTLSLDYISQELFHYREAGEAATWLDHTALQVTPEGVQKLPVLKREPLLAELEAFVQAVTADEEPPLTCEDAISALQLAELLVESGRTGRAIDTAAALGKDSP